jgi:hypothetical protein
MKTLDQLKAELVIAVKRCDALQQPAHMVRNCQSDLDARDAAWRLRQTLEYQIRELEKQA